MKTTGMLWRLASFAVAAGFVAIWQLIANLKLVSPVFLPGPDRAWASLMRGFSSGDLLTKLAGTIEHMAYGWLAASIAGIALGAVIGSSPKMRTYVAPSLEFLRPLPVSAIIPVAIAMLGLTQAMALFVIAFGAIWPIMLATIHGFAAVEPRLYEVARSLQMSRLAVIFKIALPSASPDILAGHAPQPDGGADPVGGLRNPGRPRWARPLGAAVGPRVPLGRSVRRCHPARRYRLCDVRSDVDGRTSAIGVAGGAALVVLALRALNAIGDLANCNG
jgi:ABC-type nitrate/sulfonate/bicarbonate transport system permease component